jgi:hypothetical protein
VLGWSSLLLSEPQTEASGAVQPVYVSVRCRFIETAPQKNHCEVVHCQVVKRSLGLVGYHEKGGNVGNRPRC